VENSSLPLELAEVVTALAENLERHLESIDGGEPEHAVYAELVERLRPAADALRTAGELMADQEDLPMADHDMAKLEQPEVRGAFERLVRAEAELRDLLEARMPEHQRMLRG
jgi:hypothetical protein